MDRSFLVAFVVIFRVILALSPRPGNETDRLSLLEFKAGIAGDPLGLLGSWNDSVHFCSWPGVTCGRHHRERITTVDLRSWQLEGHMSPHIGNLSFLRELILANNSFSGEIPREIGRIFRLRVLNLRDNEFSGEIPANISRCSRLQTLSLYSNNLAGRVPAEMGSLTELRTLDLGVNKLVGEIPFSLGNLSRLEGLSLRNNTLTGTIPASLGTLKNLKVFAIGMNYLEGNIPLSLYNISTLEHFSVETNKLVGNLPPDFGNTLPNLKLFYFHTNNFSGIIPATISNASNLVRFDISRNNFTGKVPSFERSSSNLQWLLISLNNLGFAETGDLDFLRDFFNTSTTSLENLGINDNNLGGAIPEIINGNNATSKSLLLYMMFGRNRITGNIPVGIGNLVGLEVLGLEKNYLIGKIPSTIGKLRMLNTLSLENNKLSGEIPPTIGNLTSLSELSLAGNNIQGNIPTSLGQCKNLQILLLARNNLSGPIPSQLISLSSLSITLDLSRNQLAGSIPLEVGKLVNLGLLDFSENKLSGEIPTTLDTCTSLEFLYFQGNFLRGAIPKGLNALKGVQEMDLSRNDLSGGVPIYFSDFRGLSYLNLSFNKLEGQVPLQGIFKNTSKFSVAGNRRLCGGLPELKLPNCASNNLNENRKLSLKTKLFVIVSCTVVGLSVILILVMLVFLRRKRRNETISEPILSVGIPLLPRISYGDLFQATDSFSSSNLIGMGSFGSVYKGILSQELNELVAIKVLNLHVSRALKSFVAECESLGNIRHRNLVKLRTICSSIDFKGNDFKALVYEFIENGNLEEWLHPDRREQEQDHRKLNIIQRINIAIDVTSSLDYLHNHCSEAIVHCDIKPSNILLDREMVAHLGDFGLAKLLRSSTSSISNQTSSIGIIRGTIGYVPPEYATGSEVSTLGDIYSYGIVLLEMFTVKRPTDNMFKDDYDLNSFASTALPDRITAIVDPMLVEEGQGQDETIVFESLVSIIKIGVSCSSKHPVERRNIVDVTAELYKIRDVLIAHLDSLNMCPQPRRV